MRHRGLIAVGVVLCVALIVDWFGEGSSAGGTPPARITDRSFAKVHRSMTSDALQTLVGPPQLTSAVYTSGKIVIQCWYYDLARPRHTQFCFDQYKVFAKRRYR
jgi:hypothetical protein